MIPELDKILGGGFERRTFNIFDVGDKVGIIHFYVALLIFLNLVLQGIPVFGLLSKGVLSTDFLKIGPLTSLGESFFGSLSGETLNCVGKYFTLVLPSSQRSEEQFISFNVHFLSGEDYV